jgi:signal transduction histidine kinase
MIVIKGIKNRFIVTLFSFLFIAVIGIADYFTGSEISFSIFYLIPILLVALYTKTNKSLILLNTLFASVSWFLAEYYGRGYSNDLIPVWNAFVRFSIFAIVGLLVLNLREKYNKITELNTELINLNSEKNKLLGMASHDLRNPISSIYAFSDHLTVDHSLKLSPEVSQVIHYIKDLSKNSLDLLSKLLDFTRIESGTVELSLKPHNYIQFVQDCISINQILANEKEINIKLETTEQSLVFNYDELHLREVLDNLLSNATKFSDPGKEILVKISITGNNKIKTEVIDKGRGIPADEQNKLFKYFQKTSTQPTSGESSTGLGLAIAKKIITEHKGHLDVISEVGKGSNFYFELDQ